MPSSVEHSEADGAQESTAVRGQLRCLRALSTPPPGSAPTATTAADSSDAFGRYAHRCQPLGVLVVAPQTAQMPSGVEHSIQHP